MKKLSLIFVLIGVVFMSNSCSNDFDLIDDWKNIPIVYGVLSKQDTAHYVRVEKAFVDPTTSAFEIAQRPDSLYYDNIRVEIERVANGQRHVMQRVDGTLEGYPRDAGDLANSPNYLYKLRADDIELVGDEEYRLLITDGASDAIITEATTTIVGDYEQVNGQPSNPMNWRETSLVSVAWRSDEESARFYDLRMRLNYREADPNDPTNTIDKSLIWEIEKGIERDQIVPRISTGVPGVGLYQTLQNNIVDAPNLIRFFDNIDVIIDAGGEDLFNYINIGQSNTGITSAQAIPAYTNLTNDAVGIFSSRNRLIIEEFNLNTETRDSLRDGRFTKNLNFN